MTMIERVARAISNSDPANAEDGWDDNSPAVKDDYRKQARAAITAMREPTEDMLKATKYPPCDHHLDPRDGVVPEQWEAMIDAALEEKA